MTDLMPILSRQYLSELTGMNALAGMAVNIVGTRLRPP